MRTNGWITRHSALTEAIGIGSVVGGAHAFCETLVLGYYGIRPTVFDLAIFLVVAVAAGVALAAISGVLLRIRRVKQRNGMDDGPLHLRKALWTVLIGVYFLVFLGIVWEWSGAPRALKLGLLALPFVAFATLAVLRQGGRVVVLCWATVCVAATLCSLQLLSAAWETIPLEKHNGAAVPLLASVLLCYCALLLLLRSRTNAGIDPIGRSLKPAMIAAAVWVGVWAFAFSARPRLLLHEHAQPSGRGTSGPNVLLVVLDTVRADHLELFGYHRQTMPNLRRFALEDCQIANRMITTAPWTLPSHASMFTGLYPSAHGAHEPFMHDAKPDIYAYPLRDDVPTLAEFMRDRGYRTAGIAANYGALSGLGLLRGFAHQDVAAADPYLAAGTAWMHRFQIGELPTLGTLIRAVMPPALQPYSKLFSRRDPPYRRAGDITDRAREWLNSNGDKPFFLFLNYFDAHQPYLPPREDDERFARRPEGGEWVDFPTERYNSRRWLEEEFDDHEKEFLVGQYDSALVSLDRELGRLMDYLKRSGKFDNTLIFVTTDHGESLFERGLLEHGNALYQPEIGGFLLVKAPASLGKIEASPVMQSVDFFPTIASVLNQPLPPNVQGSPWGSGRDYAISELFCRICGAGGDYGQWPDAFRRELVAVVVGNRKLIRSTRDPDEVYDLAADRDELRPVANPEPEYLASFESALAERNEQMKRIRRQVAPTSPGAVENLKSLGYMQ